MNQKIWQEKLLEAMRGLGEEGRAAGERGRHQPRDGGREPLHCLSPVSAAGDVRGNRDPPRQGRVRGVKP